MIIIIMRFTHYFGKNCSFTKSMSPVEGGLNHTGSRRLVTHFMKADCNVLNKTSARSKVERVYSDIIMMLNSCLIRE